MWACWVQEREVHPKRSTGREEDGRPTAQMNSSACAAETQEGSNDLGTRWLPVQSPIPRKQPKMCWAKSRFETPKYRKHSQSTRFRFSCNHQKPDRRPKSATTSRIEGASLPRPRPRPLPPLPPLLCSCSFFSKTTMPTFPPPPPWPPPSLRPAEPRRSTWPRIPARRSRRDPWRR